MILKFILYISVIVSLYSCQVHKSGDNNIAEGSHVWDYEGETGPEHWREIERTSDCGGEHQSPINIITDDVVENTSLPPFRIQLGFAIQIDSLTNNGHSIQFDFEERDYHEFNHKLFYLTQFHFHEAAEHTVNGVRYPVVIHLVHKNPEGDFLVAAVMAEEGDSSHHAFDFLEQYLPVRVGETMPVNKEFILSSILPEDKSYFHYRGSLTTPPCTEAVDWVIFKQPIRVSLRHVKLLQEQMPLNNYRNEQPLNGRVVALRK